MADRIITTAYLPATADRPVEPAPFVLTQEETMRLLRIEGSKDPYAVLYRYRKEGLKAAQIGKDVRYLLPDVLAFLETMRKRSV